MTDKEKLEKVRAEIERRKKEVKDQIVEFGTFESDRLGLYDDVEKYDDLLSFIDSMQEECNITGIKSKHATGKLKECIDNITDESLAKARMQLQEESKKCMYSKGNYTDEDRKALCDGCETECKFKPTTSVWHLKNEEPLEDKQVIICISGFFYVDFYHKKDKRFYMFGNPKHYLHEIDRWVYTDDLIKIDKILIKEPVSEDLKEDIYKEWQCYSKDGEIACINKFSFELIARHFAEWQKQKDEAYTKSMYKIGINFGKEQMKQQMMTNAVDVEVKVDAGGYPYVDRVIELYDYDKDVPLAKKGDKYKVILIKE